MLLLAAALVGPPRDAVRTERVLAAHPAPPVTVRIVDDHVEHVARVAGREHVGLGGDVDGINGTAPEGMSGVDGYPRLFAELARRGWSDADLARLANGNVLRVLEQADAVAATMASRLVDAAVDPGVR